MKHYGIRLLFMLVAALLVVLAWLWFDTQGNLRNTSWQAPAPIAPDLGDEAVHLPTTRPMDVSLFMATLDRPLFSPSRRPAPPAPKESDAKPAPDPLAGLHLYGLYTTEQGPSGMLVRVDGKVRRIGINESLGDWKLQAIREREVVLTRNGEERAIPLAISRPPVAGKAPVGGATASSAVAPAPATSSAAGAAEERRQEMEEAQRERLRRRNELRAKAGARPLSQ